MLRGQTDRDFGFAARFASARARFARSFAWSRSAIADTTGSARRLYDTGRSHSPYIVFHHTNSKIRCRQAHTGRLTKEGWRESEREEGGKLTEAEARGSLLSPAEEDEERKLCRKRLG